jgi:thiol peroxidase
MVNGPLKSLLARAVFVLDKDNRIKYAELVEDITYEPDYTKALEALKKLK